ncbi:MAG: hypothetical protein E7317_10415 [Clostridiales bacterium]|nr:hypothetical protein [Clostridiales bacterium]
MRLSEAAKRLGPARLTGEPECDRITPRPTRVLAADGTEAYRYPKSDVIQKMASFEEINEHFSTTDYYGNKKYLFSGRMKDLPLEHQKAIAEGVLYVQETFKKRPLPSTIRIQKTATVNEKSVAGYYDARNLKIVISETTNKAEAELYLTVVHEMIHHYDRYGDEAEYCVGYAIKELQKTINPNTRTAYAYADIQAMLGSLAGRSSNKKDEVLAYAIEKNMDVKKGNSTLTEIIVRYFYERNGAK